MRIIKKLLSVILCAIMILTAVSAGAFAADGEDIIQPTDGYNEQLPESSVTPETEEEDKVSFFDKTEEFIKNSFYKAAGFTAWAMFAGGFLLEVLLSLPIVAVMRIMQLLGVSV